MEKELKSFKEFLKEKSLSKKTNVADSNVVMSLYKKNREKYKKDYDELKDR